MVESIKSGTIFSGVSYLIESLQELFSGATFKLEDEGIEKKRYIKTFITKNSTAFSKSKKV